MIPLPLKKDTPVRPRSSMGASKLLCLRGVKANCLALTGDSGERPREPPESARGFYEEQKFSEPSPASVKFPGVLPRGQNEQFIMPP